MKATLQLRLLLFVFLLVASSALAFQYPDFSNTNGLVLNSDASQFGTVLRLTEPAGDEVGTAYYSTLVPVASGFVTEFQLQITEPGGGGADGMAFIIQNDSLSAVGQGGTGMGYQDIPNSLVVEFDTYKGGNGDPDDNHISVISRGVLPNDPDESNSLGLTSAIPDLKDGAVHTVQIRYVPGTLSVFFDDPNTPVLTVAVDLSTLLSLSNGAAYVGFTAATGGSWEAHDVLNWSFGGAGQSVAVEAGGAFALYTSTSFCSGRALIYQRLTAAGKTTGSPRVLTGCDASVEDIDVYKDTTDNTYWISLGTPNGKFLMRITKAGGVLRLPTLVLTPAQAGGSLGPAAIGGPGAATIYMWVLIDGVVHRAAFSKNSLALTALAETSVHAAGSAIQASQNATKRLLAFDSSAALTGSLLTTNGLPAGAPFGLLPHTSGGNTSGGISSDAKMAYSINSIDELYVQRLNAKAQPSGSSQFVATGGGITSADVSNIVDSYRFVVYQNGNGVYLQRVTSAGAIAGSPAMIGH